MAPFPDAAGQMIENVTKAVNRKQTVDEAFIDKLYADVNSLYRLDQRDATATDKADLGPLPPTAVYLLGGLGTAWALMGLYVLREFLRNKNSTGR